MNKTFLIVFHGEIINGKIIDIGEDPCFDSIPSWGICRPPTRKAVKLGDTLIFIAKVENNYFLKGWFDVGEKLDYLSALKEFPTRRNVIISKTKSTKEINWRYGSLKKSFKNKNGHTNPTFLSDIQTTSGTFYQSITDDHQIDNWKCRRIFHCHSKQFEECISKNSCLKNGSIITAVEYKNYVVAAPNNWADLDFLKITFDEIAKATNFPTPIRTPKGQHNILRFDEYKQKLFELIERRKNDTKN